MCTLINRFREFSRDRRGNFAIMFVFLSSALLMGTALSVDVARMFLFQNKLNFAVDAAALATTQGLTLGDIALEDAEETVLKYVRANLDGRNLTNENVKIDDIHVDPVARTVQIDAHTDMPMTLGGVVGYDHHRVAATSKARFSNTHIEVAMALDITGSMGDPIRRRSSTTKLKAMKDAAESAIGILLADADTEDSVRVGLVPYSASVNVSPILNKIQTTPARVCWGPWWDRECRDEWTDCVHERTGIYAYSDKFADGTAKIGRSALTCPSAKIMPLTESITALENRINSFSANGATAGHIAVAWTYYMLSPEWNTAWGVDSAAADFDEPGASKYAIIMTDGEFNTFESGGNGSTNSRNYALALCDAMKADRIKVYSIAFAVNDTNAKNLMKGCASPDSATSTYYFDADDEDDLEDAFEQIAQDIKGLRLVN